MTSELGIALVLDEHVNRPGHVPGTLADAIASLGLQAEDPGQWYDQQEHRLIEAYLHKRHATNMTDSDGRAGKIEKAMLDGAPLDSRGSFKP